MSESDASTAQPRNPQEVLFIAEAPLAPGEVRLHRASPGREIRRSLEEVKEDWSVVIRQVTEIISGTDAQVSRAGFELDEVNVSLGFNAQGKIAFIAEAGVEASISISFKREGKK